MLSFPQKKNFNSLIPDNLADPIIFQFENTFYVYATSDVSDIENDLAFSGNPVNLSKAVATPFQ